jgi:hypothetical protein
MLGPTSACTCYNYTGDVLGPTSACTCYKGDSRGTCSRGMRARAHVRVHLLHYTQGDVLHSCVQQGTCSGPRPRAPARNGDSDLERPEMETRIFHGPKLRLGSFTARNGDSDLSRPEMETRIFSRHESVCRARIREIETRIDIETRHKRILHTDR